MPLSTKGNLEMGLASKVQCAAVDVGSIPWQSKVAVSFSNTRSDRPWPWLTGAQESVPAMEMSLPGTCMGH